MCILFLHVGNDDDDDSDYSLIMVSNRDEFYNRPAKNMAFWEEDPNVIGGRDMETGCSGGTWLAMSPLRKKIGVLLNLPGKSKPNAKGRGRIVADYVKYNKSTKEYVESIKNYLNEANEFVLITVDLGSLYPTVQSYSNATDELINWTDSHLGFGNSLPNAPLKKVEAGKKLLKDICCKRNKITMKKQLIDELVGFLKLEDRHLPDSELEKRQPNIYKQLSSLYVSIPEHKYGTRTHTLILVTKTGHVDLIEITLQSPVDLQNLKWDRTEIQCDI